MSSFDWRKDTRRPAGPGLCQAPRRDWSADRIVCECGRPVVWVGSIDDGHWAHA